MSQGKRLSPWKILGIVVGVIVLSVVALIVWASAAGSRKFARMQERSRAHLAAVKAAPGRRPVLRGDAQEGNAWGDYALAQAEVKKFGKASRLGEIVDRSPKADPEVGKAALAAHGVAVEHLRRGAGRATSRYPFEWEMGNSMPTPGLLEMINTSNLVVLKARALIDEGKSREAAGVLLDLAQYGRDIGADGVLITYMIGMALLNRALDEMRDHLLAGKFDKGALEDLDRGLQVLDGSFPSYGAVLMNESLLFGGLLNESTAGGWGPQRLLMADAVERIHESMSAAGKAESLPWAEARNELDRIESDAKKAWNPISSIASPSMVKSGHIGRGRRAQLRILRVAVHATSTGRLLGLEDPFGATLRSEESPGKLKLWSVGRDGVDDGGAGEWKADAKDILLEIQR